MLQPGDEVVGFSQQAVLEPNRVKMAEAVALMDAAKERGEDPRLSAPRWNPKDNPEFFDVVVYNYLQLGRPSALAIDPAQIPMANLRWSEHMRVPFTDVRARADEAFAGAEGRGQSH
jgi:hypothetical protein